MPGEEGESLKLKAKRPKQKRFIDHGSWFIAGDSWCASGRDKAKILIINRIILMCVKID